MTNEDAIKWLDNLKNDIGNPQYECLWHYAQAIDEICAMLKEQEAVEPKHNPLSPTNWFCGKCGMCISRFHDYCPSCGQAVKFELGG